MIEARAALAKGRSLERYEYEPAPLGPFDVEIDISHCGICHSDLHLIDDDWRMSRYPLVPGHEIVGLVAAAGDMQAGLRPGDRVGVGWQRGACLACERCRHGQEHLCAASKATCAGHHGGFARKIRVDGRFVFKLPEGLDPASAAPLLCGGITVYSPLRRLGIRPEMRVGVIGIGGLGHLAIQLASAMGCEVTAFSSTAAKEEEARALGAHRFVASDKKGAIGSVRDSLDLVLNTVFVDLDWSAYAQTLRPHGTLCFVGIPGGALSLPFGAFALQERVVTGSVIGSRAAIEDMLAFAARHGIGAKVERFPFERVNEAIAKVRKNQIRYRAVLEM